MALLNVLPPSVDLEISNLLGLSHLPETAGRPHRPVPFRGSMAIADPCMIRSPSLILDGRPHVPPQFVERMTISLERTCGSPPTNYDVGDVNIPSGKTLGGEVTLPGSPGTGTAGMLQDWAPALGISVAIAGLSMNFPAVPESITEVPLRRIVSCSLYCCNPKSGRRKARPSHSPPRLNEIPL